MRALTLLFLTLPGLALAQARDDDAPAAAGWMDRFCGYAAYKSGHYQRAAESGDMAAQFNLGRIYLEGTLVERARELLRRAAEQGDEDAETLLASPTH